MPRKRPNSVILPSQTPTTRRRKVTGKELDMLVLASCSCLLTVLSHPVANALQSMQTVSTSQSAIAAQVSQAPQQHGSFYVTMPPKREEIKDDENEEE